MGDIQQEAEAEADKAGSCEQKEEDAVELVSKKSKYPYGSVFFLLSSTVGLSYSGTGLQAVLELYFARFLFVCLYGRADQLSTAGVNVYIALNQICALSAGFLADRVLGNFLTQALSIILTTVGICLLTFATWQYTVYPPDCCYGNTSQLLAGDEYDSFTVDWNANCSELHKVTVLNQINLHISPTVVMVLAMAGLILYSIGYGHTNAIQSVFIADQFTEEQAKSKERSFSWFYWCCNVGALAGESGMPVLRQSVGFIIAWLTVLGSTAVSAVFYLGGGCLYVKKKPERLKCCSSRKPSPETKPLLSESTTVNKSTCQKAWVRGKELLPFLGVFTPLIVFWAIFYQQNSTWVLQGTMMDCKVGSVNVPPDLMPSINDFLVVLIIPALDYLVYPHLERSMGIKIQSLHKMVAGMICAALSFLMSGLLQLYLVQLPRALDCHGNINIAWQLPQIVLISFAEVLVTVTGLEFAYSQAPPDFRNIITSFWYIAQALGTLLNAGLAQIPGLTLRDEFFMYTGLMVAVTVLFVAVNWRYKYRELT